MDAELFGQESHSTDGDNRKRPGLIESASGGTLFLDEVSRLPFWASVKLLDVIQQRQYLSYGGLESGPLGVRLIASTAWDLEAAVSQNQFYGGLYYYLSAVYIRVPPLRARREDIAALAQHFLAVADGTSDGRTGPHPDPLPKGEGTWLNPLPKGEGTWLNPRPKGEGTWLNPLPKGEETSLPRYRFSKEAMDRLAGYDWPGNARELASVVVHAMLLANAEEIGQECVADALGSVRQRADYAGAADEDFCPTEGGRQDACPTAETVSVPLVGGLKQIEQRLIHEVIRRCRGNKAAAARSLGLHRRTLYRLLRKDE